MSARIEVLHSVDSNILGLPLQSQTCLVLAVRFRFVESTVVYEEGKACTFGAFAQAEHPQPP